MKCMLDTCALLWLTLDPEQLSTKAAVLIEDSSGGFVVSAISFWEIGQKVRKGKLELGCTPNQFLTLVNQTREIEIHPVQATIAMASTQLDWTHKDPADRLIVQTAIELNLPLITADGVIRKFYSKAVW